MGVGFLLITLVVLINIDGSIAQRKPYWPFGSRLTNYPACTRWQCPPPGGCSTCTMCSMMPLITTTPVNICVDNSMMPMVMANGVPCKTAGGVDCCRDFPAPYPCVNKAPDCVTAMGPPMLTPCP